MRWNALLDDSNSAGQLGKTTINFFGPAEDVVKADYNLSILQNRNSMTNVNEYNDSILHIQNHVSDPVGGWIIVGNNSATGVTNRVGVSWFSEALNALGGKYTVHNCYGVGDAACRSFWMDSKNNMPALKPVTPFRSNYSVEN